MTLYDLLDTVMLEVLHAVNCGIDPRNVEVGVEVTPDADKIYGGTAIEPVKRAFRGFDWDTYKFIIETEGNLIKSDS